MKKVEIWSKQTTVKVMADKVYDKSFKKPCKLVFETAKNENSSAQIIITPDVDIQEVKFKLSHISTGKGHYLWKDAFTVYFQKYIEVKESSPEAEKYGNPKGFYPDALLPFEKAVEYRENCIKAGKTQAIFVSLKVPQGQRTGTYRGSFLLTLDGEEYDIPVEIVVWDFEVSREVHCQSDFVIGKEGLRFGEDDNFPQMYKKYVEKLIEFRLAPHRIMQFYNLPYNEGADFVEAVRYYTQPW